MGGNKATTARQQQICWKNELFACNGDVAAMRLICLTGMKYADLMSWSSSSSPFCPFQCCAHAALVLSCWSTVMHRCVNTTHEIQRVSAREWHFLLKHKLKKNELIFCRLNSTSTSFTMYACVLCVRVWQRARHSTSLSQPFIWCFEHILRHNVFNHV